MNAEQARTWIDWLRATDRAYTARMGASPEDRPAVCHWGGTRTTWEEVELILWRCGLTPEEAAQELAGMVRA